MKKKIALLGALGIAGWLLYALESQHKRNKNKSQPEGVGASGDDQLMRNSSSNQDGRQPATASLARIEDGTPVIGDEQEHLIDDHGTDQVEASRILRNIRDNAFESSDEKLAIALGRPAEEIEEWTSGNGLIDGDVILKARALAMQRGFEI